MGERNQPNGFGQLTFGPSDAYRRHKYVGDFKCGVRHGKGAQRWQDSGLYVGDFAEGVRKGKGRMIYPNGDVYEGDWAGNKKSGNGVYQWKQSGHS